MGVSGLTPFLTKHCPDVLKELPNGIKAISGKTIVIDATLLTQRFHFGGEAPNRHVASWYRFITNLRANDINSICVFDGKERNLAKARELQRRRESRATSLARQGLENERVQRLSTLLKTVRKVRKLSSEEKHVLAKQLRSVVSIETPGLPETSEDNLGAEGEEEVPKTIRKRIPAHRSVSQENLPVKKSVEKLASKLTSNYQEYRDSLPSFAKLQVSLSAAPSTSSATPTPHQLEGDPDFLAKASKNQYQLALQEVQAWEKLVKEHPDAEDSAEDEFQDLQERSQLIAESYRRRNEFPTAQTYEDSRQLLSAMGVPCVQSEAPYEGEGLASAIVLAGHADFVVSEDTDVVVYGAPLLRRITDKKWPPIEIDSLVVREALSLSRESFVDFALLLGTDFTPRLKNVGPVRALKFIQTHGSIEEVVKNETKYPPQSDISEYLEQVRLGREIFCSLPPVPSEDKLKQRPMDDASVQAVVEGFGFSKEMLAEDNDYFTMALKGNYFGDNPHYG